MPRKKTGSFDAPPRGGVQSVPKGALAGMLARTILLAAFVIVAASWALANHCTAVRPPMLVPSSPRPRSAPTYDPEAGESPVPDIFWDAG